jgi:Ni/Fe-hydrogenase subunit HybB-like protein
VSGSGSNNTSVVWGFPIANYVWWIGLGNAGTLISSLLVLTRQSWRATVSRFAEAMTLFAMPIAGLFPIFHLGRPLYFYWLAPYPDTMRIWPQWRSALVWDFWAIVSYLIVSIVFWYVGVLPDLATVRDRSTRAWQKIYGVAALGWRGSTRHWRHYHRLQITLAALATPLVCSVHSVVGLDFAESLMPGWREPIFPPYFVVGAMYSGFALVVLLAATITRAFGLQGLITVRHFEAMAKIMLMASIVMASPISANISLHGTGQSGRSRPRQVRVHRRLPEALCGHAVLQRGRAADSLVAADARESRRDPLEPHSDEDGQRHADDYHDAQAAPEPKTRDIDTVRAQPGVAPSPGGISP